MNASIGQRLGGRLPAKRNILELTGELAFDIDCRSEHQPVRNSGHAGQPADAALPVLDCLPDGLSRMTNCRNQTDAGYHHALVVRWTVMHCSINSPAIWRQQWQARTDGSRSQCPTAVLYASHEKEKIAT